VTDLKSFGEHYYRSADGRLRLFARDYPSPEGSEKTPVLMMHGLTRNSADFEPLLGCLARKDRRIIIPDQRGRGLSQYDPDPQNYRPDIYADDMFALLDSLSVRKAILIGTSLGGLMAMLMAGTNPDAIAGIVLNDIGPAVEQTGLDRIKSYVGGGGPVQNWEAAAAACKAINATAMEGFGPADWLAFAQRTCRELPDGSVEFAYDPAISHGVEQDQPTAVPPDMWNIWDGIAHIPILVIRGQNSDILSIATVQEMERRHPLSFTSVDVPGRGHAPLLDETAAVDAIKHFLAEIA
jgi:pimeloyl-ACP methyl ester carboxylesterase